MVPVRARVDPFKAHKSIQLVVTSTRNALPLQRASVHAHTGQDTPVQLLSTQALKHSHTGVRSTASPLAARSRMSCCAPASGLGAFLSCSADKPQPDGPTMAAGAAARRMDERDAVTPDAATRSSRARRKRLFIARIVLLQLAGISRRVPRSQRRAALARRRVCPRTRRVAERPHASRRFWGPPRACLVKKLRDCCSCDAIPTSKPKVRRLDCEALADAFGWLT